MKKLLDKRKQAKMHWLRDPNQNNVRHAASRHFKNKNKEAKIET